MEWWFVQGWYEGDRTGRREFMVSLFRQSVAPTANAFTLLVSVLDPSTGRTASLSQVDAATCDLFVRAARERQTAGLDPLALRTMADEVAEHGPPQPIVRETDSAKMSESRFGAVWRDFRIEQDTERFLLKFTEPEIGRKCTLLLRPVRPRIHLGDIRFDGTDTMDYASYTRLSLEGEANGEPLRGEAWLDHQWGNHGWFVEGRGEGFLGWDWTGVQLDDGREIMAIVHRDICDGRLLCRYAILTGEDAAPRLLRGVSIEPTRWWTSPVTRARYPVACRISLCEADTVLDFAPAADEQEVRVLGAIRAVWEGAGRVTGTMQGRPVTGRARVEFHGYAYIRDFRTYLDDMVKRIDGSIQTYFPRTMSRENMEQYAGPAHGVYDPDAQTAVLSRPIWDLLDRGGKHWRPIFGILMLESLGVNPEPYELVISIAVELTHAGALVIDDIEDNAVLRRGEEAVHLRYGLDVAINAGSTAYFLPFVLLSRYPRINDRQRLELYTVLSRLFMRAHLGQGLDIYWSRSLTQEAVRSWLNDSLPQKMFEMYVQKTASSVEGAAEAACIVAESDAETRRACTDFARNLGVAFQIVDDLLDFSEKHVAQGCAGLDLAEGKLTYVVVRALELLEGQDRLRLETILCSRDLRRDPAAIAEGVALVRCCGALEASQREARELVEPSWRRFAERVPPSEARTMLRVLCDFLLGLGDDNRNVAFTPGH